MNYSGSKLKCHWTNVNLILHKFLIIFSSQIHQRQRHSMLSKFIRVTLLTNSKPSDSDSEMKHKSFSVLVDIICFLFMLRTSRNKPAYSTLCIILFYVHILKKKIAPWDSCTHKSSGEMCWNELNTQNLSAWNPCFDAFSSAVLAVLQQKP